MRMVHSNAAFSPSEDAKVLGLSFPRTLMVSDERCPRSGEKRTLTNCSSSTAIYEYAR